MKKLICFFILSTFFILIQAEETFEKLEAQEIINILDQDIAEYEVKAWEAYQKQDYEAAIQNYFHYLKYNITHSNALYNLACCYGLTENEDLASKFLLYSFESGFDDLDHIKKDPDFELVRESKIFSETINKIENRLAENQKAIVVEKFLKSPIMNRVLISLPDNFEEKKSYKLIVGLHGYGSNAENFLKLMNMCSRDSLIFAVPFAPYAFSLGKEIGYSWNLRLDKELVNKSSITSNDYILNCIEQMRKDFKIDETYLFGFSQGAYFSFDIGIRNYELIDGIIPFGGGLIDQPEIEKIIKRVEDLRVFVAHGKKDNVVEFSNSQKAVELLRNNDIEVEFIEFDGSHQVPVEILQNAFNWVVK